jgi:hypothetical protein
MALTIVSVADVKAEEQSIGREGRIVAKTFPLDTGIPGCAMDFTWIVHSKGYGTPRHKHTFDQFRYTLSGVRQQDDGDILAGQCGYFPEGVAYGPQLQDEEEVGLILQFEGPSGIPYLTHDALDAARQRLIAEGGTFAKGIYTKVLPDGRKINKDSHAACFEAITGTKMEFPEPRFSAPLIMKPERCRWVPDRKLPKVDHKHLGTFGERRSGVRLTRLAAGAVMPAQRLEDAELRYLVEGSIEYAGKTWQGGGTAELGTYMFIPPDTDVGEIRSTGGGTFFIISLPMLAELRNERGIAQADRAA